MHILKSVGVISVARITALVYGCLGLIFLPFFLLFGVVGLFAGQNKNLLPGAAAVLLSILLPVIYGAMGFIMGALGALLYNLMAKWIGGFELQLELQPAPPIASYPIVPSSNSGI